MNILQQNTFIVVPAVPAPTTLPRRVLVSTGTPITFACFLPRGSIAAKSTVSVSHATGTMHPIEFRSFHGLASLSICPFHLWPCMQITPQKGTHVGPFNVFGDQFFDVRFQILFSFSHKGLRQMALKFFRWEIQRGSKTIGQGIV